MYRVDDQNAASRAQTGARNLGTIERDDLQGHNWSQIPSVLLEIGFLTNPEEDALLETEGYRQKVVDGTVEALLLWFEDQ